jgi:hypothetical protein
MDLLVKRLIELSGVLPGTEPRELGVPLPLGLTVAYPAAPEPNVTDELATRRFCDGLLVTFIQRERKAACRLSYVQTLLSRSWRDDWEKWSTVPLIGVIGWHFRGAWEDAAVAMAEALLRRLEQKLPTIVSCPVAPVWLHPKWHCDDAVVDALKHPDLCVRLTRKEEPSLWMPRR